MTCRIGRRSRNYGAIRIFSLIRISLLFRVRPAKLKRAQDAPFSEFFSRSRSKNLEKLSTRIRSLHKCLQCNMMQ
jgi:hypothetical protein